MLGDIIMIYYDPVTEREQEGKASIVKLIKVDHSFIHYYVRFVSDGRYCRRKIKRNFI